MIRLCASDATSRPRTGGDASPCTQPAKSTASSPNPASNATSPAAKHAPGNPGRPTNANRLWTDPRTSDDRYASTAPASSDWRPSTIVMPEKNTGCQCNDPTSTPDGVTNPRMDSPIP